MEINPALADLQGLIGRWTATITWSEPTHKLVGGPPAVETPASFAWSADGRFLVHSLGGGGAPTATWMIGRDDASGAFAALYADGRGVSRIYDMSFEADVWQLWRRAPGFHQRFKARFDGDRRTIEGRWEKSEDGATWENDFDLTYVQID
jgi:hypothetical protein